jgi:hypothetical protein
MTGPPAPRRRDPEGPALRAAAWLTVAMIGAVAASIGVYVIVWLWVRILAMAG